MAIFIGGYKNTTAAKVGLKINYACEKIIKPAIRLQYPDTDYTLHHVVGIDTSKLLVSKTGIWGANDLLWMGKASNHAAKLSSLDHDYPTWITEAVYNCLNNECKISPDGRPMWEARTWRAMKNATIYRSNWRWKI